MATPGATSSEDLNSPRDVLAFARTRQRDAQQAERDVLVAAVIWAEQHPPESIGLEATWFSGGGDTGISIAGPGAPQVSHFCIMEFAAAIGRSTDSGKEFIAAAVELKYRLPRMWQRVLNGDLQGWKARQIAETTFGLSQEAAAHVDQQVSTFAHKIGIRQVEKLAREALDRFMPAEALAAAEKAAEGRHVTFHHDRLTFNGTTYMEAELDLADAQDLDAAIAQVAEQLKACGSEQSLDVRRAMAAGELARHQLAFDLAAAAEAEEPASGGTKTKTVKPRQVVLYVHLSEEAITGTSAGLDLARVENHRLAVTANQVRGWCANPDTAVVVKPIIDLNQHIATDAYEVPDRLSEQTQQRDHTCIFPWCTRPARKTDDEHCIPHGKGGTTCSCNVGPMCRRHHRLKTHSAWTYTVLEPGSFLWTSPCGLQFLRDENGTLDVSRDRPARGTHPPDPPAPQHFY